MTIILDDYKYEEDLKTGKKYVYQKKSGKWTKLSNDNLVGKIFLTQNFSDEYLKKVEELEKYDVKFKEISKKEHETEKEELTKLTEKLDSLSEEELQEYNQKKYSVELTENYNEYLKTLSKEQLRQVTQSEELSLMELDYDYFDLRQLFMLQQTILKLLDFKTKKKTKEQSDTVKVIYKKILKKLNKAFKDLVVMYVTTKDDNKDGNFDLTSPSILKDREENVEHVFYPIFEEEFMFNFGEFEDNNPDFDYESEELESLFSIIREVIRGFSYDIFQFVFYTYPENFGNVELKYEDVMNDYFKSYKHNQFNGDEEDYYKLLLNHEVKGTQKNRIYNMDFHDLHAKIEEGTVNAIITDSPYFYNFNGKSWDAALSREEIYEFFVDYFESVAHTVNDDAVIVFFNLYENIELINDAIKKVTADKNYPNFNFTVLPYLEYVKTTASGYLNQLRKSEYMALAVNNWQETFLGDTGIANSSKYEFVDSAENHPLKSYKLVTNALKKGKEIYDTPINGYTLGKKIHDTTKPAYLIDEIIQRFTEEDWVILDSFSGSGSITLGAYENNRTSVACELDTSMMMRSNIRLNDFRKKLNQRPFKLEKKKAQYKTSISNKTSRELINRYFYMPLARKIRIEERLVFLADFIKDLNGRKSKGQITLPESQQTERDRAILAGLAEVYSKDEFKKIFGISSRNQKHLFHDDILDVESFNVLVRAIRLNNETAIPTDYVLSLEEAINAFDNFDSSSNTEKVEKITQFLIYLHQLIQDLFTFEFPLKRELLRDSGYEKEEAFYQTMALSLKYYLFLIEQLELLKGEPLDYFYTVEEIKNSNPFISLTKDELVVQRNAFINTYSFDTQMDYKTTYIIDGFLKYYDELENQFKLIDGLDVQSISKRLSLRKAEIVAKYEIVVEHGDNTKTSGLNLLTFYMTLRDYKKATNKRDFLIRLNEGGYVVRQKKVEPKKDSKEKVEPKSLVKNDDKKKNDSTIKESNKKKSIVIDHEEVRKLFLGGMKQAEIAKKFNTSSATISHHIKDLK
ncbi:hypothetical protein K5E_11100 [Enterococcus thailandicus]|uniref:DNA methyltransferase n=1 Tax=Enterococcus thailandicus TaxID=417368 RepID=UPI00244D8C38|nr:DNA methyltransferase [Enterococcus thailandicus]GMC02592.1 hypothetical protein K4E_01020 [Enterococcus thailandicus]GMC08971.1 hypothetical protein K5E_11100 [Enterococcus thailandicus]